ncbi:MAG: hypothetical protein IJ583_15485 [Firmicutes bacterium]|nr:hypothetical protein [Bacillota bacterium]
MKKIKIIMLISAIVAIMLLSGCAGEKPENKAEEFITAFKEKRYDDMTAMLVQGENYATQIYVAGDENSKRLFDILSENLEYKLKKVETTDEKRATVTYEMTNTDTAAVMNRFLQVYFDKLKAEDANGVEEKDIDEAFDDAMRETLEAEDNETVTKDVEIKMFYSDDGWLIVDDWAVFDGLMGGYVAFANSASNALGGAMVTGSLGGEEAEQTTEAATTQAATAMQTTMAVK